MRTIIRNNYTPHVGDYHDKIVHDEERNKLYLFDCDGVFTDVSKTGVRVLNEKGQSTTDTISQKLFTDEVNSKQDTLIAGENITIEGNVISASEGVASDYEQLRHLPNINDVTLIGNKTAADLGLQPAGDYVEDANYVHTDNNYTTQEKTKLAGLSNYDDTEVRGLISDVAGDVEELETRVDAAEEDIDETIARVDAVEDDVSDIDSLIPDQATSSNQLADKAFVNSSVQTATANFRGNWATWAAVPTDPTLYPVDYAGVTTPSTNDYLVVQDASGYTEETLEGTWRFKYGGVWATDGKNGWNPEYQVNETPLTAAQLAALNSGATTALISQITTNENDIAGLETSKQDTLTAGDNISIVDNEISATDTTYDDFTGATSSAAGEAGLVPAPTAADTGKFLKGDGTWGEAGGGGGVQYSDLFADGSTQSRVRIGSGASITTTDTSSAPVVIGKNAQSKYSLNPDNSVAIGEGALASSQNCVVIGYESSASGVNAVSIGSNYSGRTSAKGPYATAIGAGAEAGSNSYHTYAVAIGARSRANVSTGVAVGAYSVATQQGEFSIGGSGLGTTGYAGTSYRKITNVYDGENAHDAVTYGQLNSRVPAPTAGDVDKFLKGDGTWASAGSASVSNHTLFI